MKLSKVERLLLANQFELLSRDENNNYLSKKDCILKRDILLEGYEHLYSSEIFSIVSDEIIDDDTSKFVLDILGMYDKLHISYINNIQDGTSTVDEKDITFTGFDGNEEIEYYSFCKFFIEDMNRYERLREMDNFALNSHSSRLGRYRRQLDVYKSMQLDKKNDSGIDVLSDDQIQQIIAIR